MSQTARFRETQRELTILRFLATSMSTMEIADELCLSVNTVKKHLAAIYRSFRPAAVATRCCEPASSS